MNTKKKLICLLIIFFSFNVMALDEYSSATKTEKDVSKAVLGELGIPTGSKNEGKIFNALKAAFSSEDWNGHALYADSSDSSKFKDSPVTYIDYTINTSDHGIFCFSFMYYKNIDQILVSSKQFRYGSKDTALEVFTTEKKKEKNRVEHESDSYALLQEDGWIDFTAINLSGDNGGIIYYKQTIINL